MMVSNVTFVFKSFERQYLAKRLYHNIQSYYPGVSVIIADDSSKPLNLRGNHLTVIQLPFNTGLSYGLNRAIEKVNTPYMIRMDDDELLCPFSEFGRQLNFLQKHPEVDLVGVLPLNILDKRSDLSRQRDQYLMNSMSGAPEKLLIPHRTRIDEEHVVVGKAPNIFMVRTDKMCEIGYDDNIRMIDHNDFFWRAAGHLVSVLDENAFVFHSHNLFDKHYDKYRSDVDGDRLYILVTRMGFPKKES